MQSRHERKNCRQHIEILQQFGVPYELLDRDDQLFHEPALADIELRLAGPLRLRATRPATASCSPLDYGTWPKVRARSSA